MYSLPSLSQEDSIAWRYKEAYHEISGMLEGKRPLSIKRAVFVSEWAYLNGHLDYEKDFCEPIISYCTYLKQIILLNKWDNYKTAKQIALCNFFFYPCNGNDKIPFEYDFSNEYPEDDWHYQLVSRTLKTHKGQCHSLPWTFKIIAEELGANVYIAHAPRHSFIMYQDEDNLFPEDWVNVELTSHQYQPTFWIKEHFNISDSAITVGTYLKPLTNKQCVACQLSNLAMVYHYKFNQYDTFTLKCTNKSLEYFQMNPIAIIIKGKSLETILKNYFEKSFGIMDEESDSLMKESIQCLEKLKSTYWTRETEELKRKWNQRAFMKHK